MKNFSKLIVLILLSLQLVRPVLAQPPTAKIIDGSLVSENDFPFVARLNYDGDLLCTGTLVGSRYILTAAHCFYGDNNQRAVGNTDVVARMAGRQYTSSKVTIHPTYQSRASACVEGETDAAVIELSEDVTGIGPIELLDSPLPVNTSLILAGYGTQGSGASGENGTIPPVGSINIGTTILEGYGDNPPALNFSSSYIYWTFDGGEANTASGDSGGPAFYDLNSHYYLAAITCGGDGNAEINTLSFDTRADLIKSWVNSITSGTPVTPTPNGGINLKKALLQFDYEKEDFLDLSGTIDVGSKFKPSGKKVTVHIGGYSKSFKLNSSGQSTGSTKNYFDLIGTISRSAFKKSVIKFSMSFENTQIFKALYTLGFPISEDAYVGQEVSLPVSITVNGVTSSKTVVLVFREKDSRWVIKSAQ